MWTKSCLPIFISLIFSETVMYVHEISRFYLRFWIKDLRFEVKDRDLGFRLQSLLSEIWDFAYRIWLGFAHHCNKCCKWTYVCMWKGSRQIVADCLSCGTSLCWHLPSVTRTASRQSSETLSWLCCVSNDTLRSPTKYDENSWVLSVGTNQL